MCLAIPAKVVEIKGDNLAQVDLLGVGREVSLDLTPQAQVGDFVLVHAGFRHRGGRPAVCAGNARPDP